MPWKGNQQTYYCHSPVLEPESWGPLWLWWWRCGTGVLHFTHFLVPFSAWLNPWDPFGFPARNDQKHIETPCWPLRRSRGSKPNDFKVCEKKCCSGMIHLYPFVHIFDTEISWTGSRCCKKGRHCQVTPKPSRFDWVLFHLFHYFHSAVIFWRILVSHLLKPQKSHAAQFSRATFLLQVRPEVLSSVDHTQHPS